MTDEAQSDNSSRPKSGRVLYLFLKALGIALIIPAIFIFFLGLSALISGDGFTDAAPWWVFLFMIAAVLGIPGIAFLLIARYISRKKVREVK